MDTLQKARVSGLAVRVTKESRMGFSFTSALDASSLQKTVDTAASQAGVMPLDPDAPLPSRSSSYPTKYNHGCVAAKSKGSGQDGDCQVIESRAGLRTRESPPFVQPVILIRTWQLDSSIPMGWTP